MMQAQRLIGLFGGTFDPVHNGHLHIARAAFERAGFDQLHLVPCKQSPHRDPPIAAAAQRLHMLDLAVGQSAGYVIDTCELEREAPSYAFDTVVALRRQHGDSHLCCLLGVDAFLGFCRWHRWQEILQLAHLLVVCRPGYTLQNNEVDTLYRQQRIDDLQQFRARPAGGIAMLELDAPPISATEIRRRLRAGEEVNGLLPQAVIEWLKNNPVYSSNHDYK